VAADQKHEGDGNGLEPSMTAVWPGGLLSSGGHHREIGAFYAFASVKVTGLHPKHTDPIEEQKGGARQSHRTDGGLFSPFYQDGNPGQAQTLYAKLGGWPSRRGPLRSHRGPRGAEKSLVSSLGGPWRGLSAVSSGSRHRWSSVGASAVPDEARH
jgi:hypothetical protein